MARPIKNNAEYFSHDADMRNDVKVKALRRRFSHTGYAVWCYILETLTDTDFFEVDYRALNRELIAADFDVSVEELQQIVEYCCKIGLLQVNTDETLLTSDALKRRFSGLITKRERDRERLTRLLNKRQSGNSEVIETRNQQNDNSRSENTHSKEEESKGKKSKGEKSKVKVIYPYQDIAAMWNDICGGSLPRIKTLNDNRRQKIKCRLDEFGGKDKEDWLAHTKDLFERVIASDFLRGGNNSGWTATFDWVFENAKNWVKVVEGNYDNNRGARNAQQQQRTQSGVTLGVGEYIEQQTGRRTYGTGKATIPPSAPARPSERHSWDSASKSWVLL